MNSKLSKRLRKVSYDLAGQWLKTMLSPEEQAKVTPQSVRAFEAQQDQYVYGNGTCRVSAYSSKYFYKKLKHAARNGILPNFQLKNVLELG